MVFTFAAYSETRKFLSVKKFLFILALCATAWSVRAQESTFNEGDIVINAGVGFGSTIYSGRFYTIQVPPISVSGEYALIEDFIEEGITLGVGGFIGYSRSRFRAGPRGPNEYGWRYNYTIIGVRGALHYPLIDDLDTYAGAMLSINSLSSAAFGNVPPELSPASSGIGLSLFVGGRYWFKENIAAMGEFGWGVTFANIGIAIKI